MTDAASHIEIKKVYGDYAPPADVERIVRRMLAKTDPKYLGGLRTIVLRSSTSLNRRRRRAWTRSRGKRVAIRECLGLYHAKWRGEPAWIELFVDRLFEDWPRLLLRVPLMKESIVGLTLFHEMGHHVHYTKAPEFHEQEDVADKWRDRLMANYLRRRLGILWHIVRLLFLPFRPITKRLARAVERRAKASSQ